MGGVGSLLKVLKPYAVCLSNDGGRVGSLDGLNTMYTVCDVLAWVRVGSSRSAKAAAGRLVEFQVGFAGGWTMLWLHERRFERSGRCLSIDIGVLSSLLASCS